MIAQSDAVTESVKPSECATYFKQINEQVANHYSLDCLVVAREIARRLINEGKCPAIAVLVRFEMTEKGPLYDRLTPLKYNGAVTFTRHYVCCCDGVVFDPILDSPVAAEGYTNLVFGIEIPISIFVDAGKIHEYISLKSGYAYRTVRDDLAELDSGG